MSKQIDSGRGQVGIGTLLAFLAMVIVSIIAGGVLIETAGLLESSSEDIGEESSSRVTDRVVVPAARASYSGGSMDSVVIHVKRAPGAGDIDLSELVIHWLDSSGSTEITDSTFSITPIRGSGTVLTDRSNLMTLSDFGRTIAAGESATVRLVTEAGGVTTVVLRAPASSLQNGSASLLRGSVGGNPARDTDSSDDDDRGPPSDAGPNDNEGDDEGSDTEEDDESPSGGGSSNGNGNGAGSSNGNGNGAGSSNGNGNGGGPPDDTGSP